MFKSKLQARYMHFMKEKGRLPEGVNLDEWDKKTDFKHLPEDKMFSGGEAGEYPEHEEEHFEHLNDDPEWNEHDEDTSGEPTHNYADGGEVSGWDNLMSNLTSGKAKGNSSWAHGGMIEEEKDMPEHELDHHLARALIRRKRGA